MEAFLGKQYKLESSKNYNEYLIAIGVPLVFTRKLDNDVSPVAELKQDGDEYVLSFKSDFKNVVTKFKPNVEMDDETLDGRKIKTTFSLDGITLKEKQVGLDGKISNIDRIFSHDAIKMVIKIDDITCTRIYKAQ